MSKTKLMLGDNILSLKKLPENSVDSIVTDPPYGLSFMGKKWDYDVPSVEFWKEAYRVLKPGGHVLSFGGTRTYHRMVVNIEDAGFEIRDQIMWLYGSGFPKSHNIGKAVDKIEGNEGKEVIDEKWIKKYPNGPGGNTGNGAAFNGKGLGRREDVIKKYISENKYEGWGTALKPSNEPICVARKPLSEKTIAENVIKWGTGGINIDGTRIGSEKHIVRGTNISGKIGEDQFNRVGDDRSFDGMNKEVEGRFPANIILDETAAEFLDLQSGILKSGDGKSGTHKINRNGDTDGVCKMDMGKSNEAIHYGDKGGASRFFYVAKVSKKERNLGLDGFEEKKKDFETTTRTNKETADKFGCERKGTTKNTHPTLKPINLMTYLCRLVTPEGGIVLDPFMGSGSTGIAALLEGFRFVGMEMDGDYFKIAEARINSYEEYRKLLK